VINILHYRIFRIKHSLLEAKLNALVSSLAASAASATSHETAYMLMLLEGQFSDANKRKWEIFIERLLLKESPATAYSNAASCHSVIPEELAFHRMSSLPQM
jgi:hypothetical protein